MAHLTNGHCTYTNLIMSSSIFAIWCEQLSHWKSSWCWERLRAEGQEGIEEEMAGWHHQCNGHELRQTSGDDEEQVCCSLCSPKETERLHFHFSLSCIGEGNGNPLQCSCPENPRDQGAWWAAIYGVAQSQTRLKRLSSSSSSIYWKY